jgi:SAM-dependent methyltransferase
LAEAHGDRAATFDAAAALYQRARPDYPAALFDHLIEASGLGAGDRLLEVGCASGKATLPLARRGFRITCIERGANLARAARRNLAAFADVSIIEARFEDWRPPDGVQFDLVFAATAWHWVDPEVRYQGAWQALRPGGHLAFWDALHVLPDDGDPFFLDIQDVYDEIGEGMPPGTVSPRPGELPDRREEVEAGGLFEVVDVRHFDWETVYDAEGYIDLLNTFSGHIAMEAWQRDRLYAEIRRRLAERSDGRLRRHWGAVLHVARRRG